MNEKQSQWIPVTERLPEIDMEAPEYARMVNVLAVTEGGRVREMRYASNGWASTERGRKPRWEEPDGSRLAYSTPTHWMPMPAGPEAV